ncbi:MAG TPA: fibronectin type III domain-containing protein, partial [Blastocatellia bacterium]|nr:fibronectin type III domain-containing protein [Blastocatellia bacterium]
MKVYPTFHPVTNRLCLTVVLTVFLLTLPAFAQPTLISLGSSWKYLDDGSNQGSVWVQPGFNDQDWKTGTAKFGYGVGDETTTIDYGHLDNHKHITTYFRSSFTLNHPASYSQYRLRLLRADGAVVYLNGKEVFRSNMPTGRVSYITLASATVSPAEAATLIETTINASAFVQGLNYIAVEVHRHTGHDSLKSFDLGLSADSSNTTPPPPPQTAFTVSRGPYLQMGTPNSIIVRWRTNAPTDSRVSFGEHPNRLIQAVTELTLTTEHILRLTNLTPNTRYYYSVGTSSQPLSGGDDSHSFVTAPTFAKPTRVWVLGDAGTWTDDQRRVRDAYANFTGARGTDVWLMLGDNAYVDGTDEEYQRAVFDLYPTFLRQNVLWPTIGNHDTAGSINPPDSLPYYQMFTLPRN